MPDGRVLDERLDDERKRQPRRALHLPAHREDREVGHADAMVEQQFLRERLAPRDDHAARIASGVRHLQQLEKAHDVLVEQHLAVEFLEQVEHRVRLPLLDGVADREQLVLHAEGAHFVADRAEVADDVVLRLPDVDLLFGVPLERVGRHQLRMHQREDPQALHTAIQSRRPCCAMNSIVRAVSSTMKSVSSCRSRAADVKLELATAADHVAQHGVERELVLARSISRRRGGCRCGGGGGNSPRTRACGRSCDSEKRRSRSSS